jgi:hypothetical protein
MSTYSLEPYPPFANSSERKGSVELDMRRTVELEYHNLEAQRMGLPCYEHSVRRRGDEYCEEDGGKNI